MIDLKKTLLTSLLLFLCSSPLAADQATSEKEASEPEQTQDMDGAYFQGEPGFPDPL